MNRTERKLLDVQLAEIDKSIMQAKAVMEQLRAVI